MASFYFSFVKRSFRGFSTYITPKCITKSKNKIFMQVHLKPGSKDPTKITKICDEFIEIKVNEIPEKGKANKALVEFLQKYWNGEINIARGSKSRYKTIEFDKNTSEITDEDIQLVLKLLHSNIL